MSETSGPTPPVPPRGPSGPGGGASGSFGSFGTGPRPVYLRPAKPLPLKPRRVRGGVKISSAEQQDLWSKSWAAQRWVRLIEQGAPGKRAVEGLEYAVLGQTKSLHVEHGALVAMVQGRAERTYQTKLSLTPLTAEQWDRVVQVMTDQAVYAAKLLAGDLPTNIEDVFSPLGLKLFVTEPSELTCSCTCVDFTSEAHERKEKGETGPTPWCKHAACAVYLFAQRLSNDPFQMFKLRGLDGAELFERLRHNRAVANASKTNPSVYVGRVPGVSDAAPMALEATRDFWELPPELEALETPIEPPPVSHPLLRRLGPSPLATAAPGKETTPPATFPLVGLLASCYETISEAVIREERGTDGAKPE